MDAPALDLPPDPDWSLALVTTVDGVVFHAYSPEPLGYLVTFEYEGRVRVHKATWAAGAPYELVEKAKSTIRRTAVQELWYLRKFGVDNMDQVRAAMEAQFRGAGVPVTSDVG